MVANYYKPGPATLPGAISRRIVSPSTRSALDDVGRWYVADNVVVGSSSVTPDNWHGGVQPGDESIDPGLLRLDKPWAAMPIRMQPAEEAYLAVLRDAGAALPKRDAVDLRINDETRKGVATYEGTGYQRDRKVVDASKPSGMIDSPDDVGGWPELASLPAPLDSDGDGMPDAWEEKFGLDPRAAGDVALDRDGDGYTDVEEYLNGSDPTQFVDYTLPENNINALRK